MSLPQILNEHEDGHIITDNEVELVFVTDVVKEFMSVINKEHYEKSIIKIKVSDLLRMKNYSVRIFFIMANQFHLF